MRKTIHKTYQPSAFKGTDLSEKYKDYYLSKLAADDPRCAVLGKYTSCCQSATDAGEEPTIFGISDPSAGFYVICRRSNKYGQPDTIVSQCLAWKSSANAIVFDSIESQSDFSKKHTNLIADFYMCLANKLCTEHGFDRVNVGCGNTPEVLRTLTPPAYEYPVAYYGYRDSQIQFTIADNSLPLMLAYLKVNPESALHQPLPALASQPMSLQPLKKWYELCIINQREDLIVTIEPFVTKDNSKELTKYLTDLKEWINLINGSQDIPFETIKDYIGIRGINPAISFDQRHPRDEHSFKENIVNRCAREGDFETLKWLIDYGADLNQPGLCGQTATQSILATGDLEKVKYLKEKGANLLNIDFNSNTSSNYAARSGNVNLCNWLIAECGANPKDSLSPPLLFDAARGGNIELMKIFTEQYQLDLQKLDADGNTVLHLAINEKSTPELIEWLMSKGLDGYQNNGFFKSPIELAIQVRPDLFALLFRNDTKQQAEVAARKLIARAVELNNIDILKHLIANGVDLNKR